MLFLLFNATTFLFMIFFFRGFYEVNGDERKPILHGAPLYFLLSSTLTVCIDDCLFNFMIGAVGRWSKKKAGKSCMSKIDEF